MSAAELAAAADRIHAGSVAGAVDPVGLPPWRDHDHGLRVQLGVLDRWLASGERLGGWKIGMTAGDGRDQMGPGFRPFGYVLESRIFSSGCLLDLAAIGTTVIETEVAVLVGRPLRGAVTPDEVVAAVAAVMPAFEIVQRRLPGPAPDALLLANDLGQYGVVLGAPRRWERRLGEVTVDVVRDGAPVATVGPGFDIDEPAVSIAALCASLDRFGLGLEPGQRVITGAYFMTTVEGPSHWRARFAPDIGEVSATFT